jgi:uncharacterized protein (TIGR02594 family)
MQTSERTLFDQAIKYMGVEEIGGEKHNAMILAMLQTVEDWPQADEVPWCSGAMNFWAWEADVEMSRSLLARSWGLVGINVRNIHLAVRSNDIVVLKQPGGPGPDDYEAPGHVGIYVTHNKKSVWLLGGNQSDKVSIASYPRDRVIWIRRLRPIRLVPLD